MWTCLLFGAAGLVFAQSAASTATVDINGNLVPGTASVATDGTVTDLRQSINGREVPLEQTQEKVLSADGTTTVKERIVRHFGANGVLVSTDRVVSEETKTSDGSTVRETTYRSDLNGNNAQAERRTVETHKAGETTLTDTTVEKPSLSGSFQVAEKRSATSEPDGDGKKENETVMLRDANGNLYEAQRISTTETKTGDQVVRNSAVYEPNVDGQLSMTKQNVVRTTTNPDGTSSQEIETYGRTSSARAQEQGAPPSLTEKRTIERRAGSGGAVVETQTVQLPSVNFPGQLEPARTVSETVCRGECDKKN